MINKVCYGIFYDTTAFDMINKQIGCLNKDIWWSILYSGALTSEHINYTTGPHRAVGNVSGNRCESDCRSRGWEFDPSPVPYFRGD